MWTSAPCLKWIFTSSPETSARIATVENASTFPIARVVSGTDFWTTVAALTGTISARGPPFPPVFTSARAVAAATITTTAMTTTILRRLRLAGAVPAGVSGPSFMDPPNGRGERPGEES